MPKPRYWHVAYPLLITSLCVAPHQVFLKNWTVAFEAGLSKLKVGCSPANVTISLIRHGLGQAISDTCYEWNDAINLDLSISVPGINIRSHLETRTITKALLPNKPASSLPK